jgi:hypothetical protein
MLLIIINNFANLNFEALSYELILWSGLGALGVGFGEEMITRGSMVVGLRSQFGERFSGLSHELHDIELKDWAYQVLGLPAPITKTGKSEIEKLLKGYRAIHNAVKDNRTFTTGRDLFGELSTTRAHFGESLTLMALWLHGNGPRSNDFDPMQSLRAFKGLLTDQYQVKLGYLLALLGVGSRQELMTPQWEGLRQVLDRLVIPHDEYHFHLEPLKTGLIDWLEIFVSDPNIKPSALLAVKEKWDNPTVPWKDIIDSLWPGRGMGFRTKQSSSLDALLRKVSEAVLCKSAASVANVVKSISLLYRLSPMEGRLLQFIADDPNGVMTRDRKERAKAALRWKGLSNKLHLDHFRGALRELLEFLERRGASPFRLAGIMFSLSKNQAAILKVMIDNRDSRFPKTRFATLANLKLAHLERVLKAPRFRDAFAWVWGRLCPGPCPEPEQLFAPIKYTRHVDSDPEMKP